MGKGAQTLRALEGSLWITELRLAGQYGNEVCFLFLMVMFKPLQHGCLDLFVDYESIYSC